MATNKRSNDHMPLFIIDTCSPEDNEILTKRSTTTTTIEIPSKYNPFSRSLSLPNYGQAYKDLSGNIHYSASNRLKNSFIRSHSYPNNYLLHEKLFRFQSPTATINGGMDLLDPYNGTQSPGGSSSRYSLYGSFFDLSESGYHPSLIKADNKLLTIDGKPLLIVDNASKLSTNTYQDKCKNWLTHLESM
ncbi:unnamed protein product [Adineta steineri]|uniref:Uncharacterized protein n=1 Tax=Adineta steineri TaxID=433720 RepID=A0A814S7N3_9BILA|nr:unnamed protein product [Adineta steineri]CAF1423726.1 unnamed protein product [Adineta steineri]CAF3535643.1 unnamed protein product [Adineta steineri]CAF3988182.1 unnamed protein product [Adineta steineri]